MDDIPNDGATWKLRAVICGGGLAGLGTAIALQRKNIQVTVLEAASQLSEIGAGIQIPPNSSRVLEQYGLGDKLREKVSWPRNINIRRYATGETVGITRLHPALSEAYGSAYWLIHRADYQRILFNKAIELGVKVVLSARVASVDTEAPSVTTTEGQIFKADIVVGADGIRSEVRSFVLPNSSIKPTNTDNCAYRATVSMEEMRKDPETAKLMSDLNSNAWIGHQRHVMAYPIRQGAIYNLVLSHPNQANAGEWNRPGDIEHMNAIYADFDPVIRKAISRVESCLLWTLADLPPLPSWLDESGKVVLIGDAAHAMVPYLAQGASMSIEDGAVLAECLARVKARHNIPRYLQAFQAIRKPRCEKVQQGSIANGRTWHLPDGPEQVTRDQGMKRDDLSNEEAGTNGTSAQLENPNPWSDRSFQPWLFGYDCVAETNRMLDELRL